MLIIAGIAVILLISTFFYLARKRSLEIEQRICSMEDSIVKFVDAMEVLIKDGKLIGPQGPMGVQGLPGCLHNSKPGISLPHGSAIGQTSYSTGGTSVYGVEDRSFMQLPKKQEIPDPSDRRAAIEATKEKNAPVG